MEDRTPDSAALAASLTSPAESAPVFDRHYDAVHAYLQRRVGPDAAGLAAGARPCRSRRGP